MFLIIAGFSLLVIMVWGFTFFYRIGKPVNAALSDAYYHHAWKKKIVHAPMGNWFELGYHETGADPATFTVLSRDFGKDQNTIFWKGRKQDVDYATFQIDNNRIPKDAFRVYYDKYYDNELKVVTGADPASYQPFKAALGPIYRQWHQDKHAIYLEGEKIAVDRSTFVLLNSTLGVDSLYVYVVFTDVTKGDKTTVLQKESNPGGKAIPLSANYARIGNSIVLSNWKNEFAMVSFSTIDSIRVVNERNIVVNGQWVSDGIRIEGVDAASWQELGRDHFKDKDNVYVNGKRIADADPGTFEVVFELYSKDKNHAYYEDKKLAEVNPSTFHYKYNTGIATDGSLSFKDGNRIKPDK
jgi:hypothetical protein